jgi:serine/threonine protein phosphatase 1
MKRTFVIGDIHGCYETLEDLLARISPDPRKDSLVFLGDYIDRGPDSKKVISRLLTLQREFVNFVALKGNHEQMLHSFLAGRDQDFFLMMGGWQTLASYNVDSPLPEEVTKKLPADHYRFLEELLDYWEDDENIYVHAGLQPTVPLAQQTHEWLLWSRLRFVESEYDFGKKVIFGHTPFRIPRIQPNKIGIDTGAVYGGHLTCLILPEMEFVSVPVAANESTGSMFP